ncbi:MAG: ribosome-associated ATPase/putative transporter RbbA [Myxococcota bacterium]
MPADSDFVARLTGVRHRYGSKLALRDVTTSIPARRVVGLIGPDGVGKSTFMGLVAGARRIQQGQVSVLGADMADARQRSATCLRVAYMPQGLGKNLYAELSVLENLDFFGRLHGRTADERLARIDALLQATGLDGFRTRPAGKLSGGMKQKLGLCCALLHEPDFLILDEPTTGVDPLSRAQFWQLISEMRAGRPEMSVLVSTAYMDEADRFDWLIAMDAGALLAEGSPRQLEQRTGTKSLEDAFVALLPGEKRGVREPIVIPPRRETGGAPAIVARGLTRRFGRFTAVDDVSFSIDRGEIFGFLGSNGCGKTTTMKVLTGLLPASEGHAELFGRPVDAHDLESRRRVGYMSQSFSLYDELTVLQNLDLHARLFRIPRERIAPRIAELLDRFGLADQADRIASELPFGIRQRLSLAVTVIHEPELLILDEPTSGVDPVARDAFWRLLIDLSRNQGVTIFVSTHQMSEALRCDRISLMHAGAVLACDAPAALIEARGAANLEEAFIAYIRDAMQAGSGGPAAPSPVRASDRPETKSVEPRPKRRWPRLGRLLAHARRETLEVLRDPVRLAFAFGGSALLMLVFAYGITTDVDGVRYAALDLDRSPESRAYLREFAGSRYFSEQDPLASEDEAHARLQANEISLSIEIPPGFGRDRRRGGETEVFVEIDGTMPFRGEMIDGYVQGVHAGYLRSTRDGARPGPDDRHPIEPRFRYNPTFESVYTMVPGVPAMLLVLIPAILMAVSVAREKELGSIVNFYVTPTTRLEFLLGKQAPYVVLAFANFVLLTLMSVFLFDVPLEGSAPALALGALLYVTATTGLGLLISSLTSSQVAAVFATAILTMMPTLQFSGLLQPVATLEGPARLIGAVWPTTYYLHASVGAFTKGLGARGLESDLVALALFIPCLTIASVLALREQDR